MTKPIRERGECLFIISNKSEMSGGEESDVLTGKLWWASSDFHRVRREAGKGERSGYTLH